MPSLPRPSLWLFDMDRTLIALSDVYPKAYAAATRQVYGFEVQLAPAQHAGRTQSEITRMMCQAAGLSPEIAEAGLRQTFDVSSDVAIALMPPDLRSRLLPGVAALLADLHARGCALGLVTGTVTRIAREAMQRAGLWECFCTGAFGEEGPDRVALLRLAVQRARERCGFTGAFEHVVVVGDTPHDVAAGKVIGARSVAVATGYHSFEDLRACAPDALLPDFSDLQATLRALRVE